MLTSLPLKKEVIKQLGFFPSFLIPAIKTPKILESLLEQTVLSYTKNPLPALFKEKLLVILANCINDEYLLICHSCTLRSLGLTGSEILKLYRLTIPTREIDIQSDLQILYQRSPYRYGWQENSQLEQSILRCSIFIFLQPSQAAKYCTKIRQSLGKTVYNHLIVLLSYIKLCHQWVQSHPEISYKQDRRAQLHLAPLLLEEIKLAEFLRRDSQHKLKTLPSKVAATISPKIDNQLLPNQSPKLNLNPDKLKMCLVNVPFPVMIYGRDGQILHLNQNWIDHTGYDVLEIPTIEEWQKTAQVKQQAIVKSSRNLSDTSQAYWGTEASFQELVNSLLDLSWQNHLELDRKSRTVGVICSEVSITTRSGEQRFWELYSAPLTLDSQGDELTISIAKDVTDFMRQEIKLAQTEAKLKLVLEATKTGSWSWNLKDNRVEICHRAQAILGLENFDHSYESFLKSIHADERQSVDLAAIKAVKAGKDLELKYRIVKSDNTISWIRAKGKLSYDLAGKATHLTGIVTDITAHQQPPVDNHQIQLNRQQDVSQSLGELKNLLNLVPYHLFVVDVKTKLISFCNLGLAQSLGFANAEQVIGKAIAECFPTKNARQLVIQHEQVLSSGEVWRIQEEVVLPDGKHFFDTVITPLKNAEGETCAVLHTSSDIPDLAAAQEALSERTAQLEAANKELESFSYSVSHDLQAPLRRINSFSDVLWDNYNSHLDSRGKHYLQRIQANSERMSELIDALLQLSRVTRSQMQQRLVNLSEIAREISEELQAAKSQREVEFTITPDLTAKGDPRLLRIVLNNLLDNAWKYTSKRSPAKIKFGISTGDDGQPVYFIQDNGAGFDADYADKLFTAFKRLHTEAEFPGTGIGLATVQRIIYRHGGKLWAEGKQDQGATFYFSL